MSDGIGLIEALLGLPGLGRSVRSEPTPRW